MENNAGIIGKILRIFVAIWQELTVPGSLCMGKHKCKTAVLIQPSSEASECVYSLLNNSFKENQARALEDLHRNINNVAI